MQITTTRTKRCTQCGRELSITEFHRRRHYTRSGHRAACRDCTSSASRLARIERPPEIDRLKQIIRARTREAIRRGELTPLPCSVCGNVDVDAHHPDYDADNAHLVVDWLCEKHHSLEHGKRPWTSQMELFPAMG